MQKRSSRTGGSTRVDGILRYRSANEGILCSARCRELSRTGLTATIERPVFPGDLLRFDLEPAGGGRSIMGLARVAWTGGDPEGPAGTQIMRIRFLSLGDASEHALLEWLDELSDVSEDRPSSPLDDSSVRALGRAIADSLLPPPPVLPGAQASDGSGLTKAPVAVPNRPSIPPPPGLYTRSSRDLTHSVEHVGAVATSIAPPLPPPSVPPPPPSTRPSMPPPPSKPPIATLFPHPPSLFELDAPTVPAMPAVSPPPSVPPSSASPSSVTARPTLITPAPALPLITPAPSAALAGSAAKSQALAGRRSADVRERLSRLQRRSDNTPLSVPVDEKLLLLRDDAPPPLLVAPPVAISAQPPLPLGALLNAPPQTTRRSTPPPANLPPPPAGASSSWPALRVPPAIAAHAREAYVEPLDRPSRETIPPPAKIPEMPPLRVSTPAPAIEAEESERFALPLREDRTPPRSDAPWSMPALPARGTPPRPWLAICLGSLAAGAGLAYLVYGPSLLQRGEEAAAPAPRAPAVAAAAPARLEPDDSLAPLLAVPSERSAAAVLNGPEAPQIAAPAAKLAVAGSAQPAGSPAKSLALSTPGSTPGTFRPAAQGVGAGQAPRVAGPAAEPALVLAAVPMAAAKEIEPGDKLPPPAPALPAALGGALAGPEPSEPTAAAAQGSRLERARACLAQGDLACATALLQNAGTEAELELWIETLRAQGDGLEARRAMKRFVETYPEGRRAAIYRRILSNAQ